MIYKNIKIIKGDIKIIYKKKKLCILYNKK